MQGRNCPNVAAGLENMFMLFPPLARLLLTPAPEALVGMLTLYLAVVPPVQLAARTAPSLVPLFWVSPKDSLEFRVPTNSGCPLFAVKIGAILHPPSKCPSTPLCDRKNGSVHSSVWV